MNIDISRINFDKLNGLVPAVVTDSGTQQVLMVGFMNREALTKTLETKLVTFFSRSRNRLWTKGETSGNFLRLGDIKTDCDFDSLLISAVPEGNTCHLDKYSCFGLRKSPALFIDELFQIIRDRKEKLPENSYTAGLFKEGENRIIQKVGEEAVETLIAAKNNDRTEIIDEVSDLIYHLLVLLAEKEISPEDISSNLEKRHKK